MTDKKVMQLAQEMINFFTEICHFESKEDIFLFINEGLAEDRYGDTTFVDDSGYCLIRLANRKETTKKQLEETICHEYAHILTREFFIFYDNFIGLEEGDKNSPTHNVFIQISETIAKRITRILLALWQNNQLKEI
jgi:hypothetical protein